MSGEANGIPVPIPRPAPASRPFWEGLRERRLMLQRSVRTGRYVFYPRAVSPFGAGDTLEWVESPGRGTVYSFTIARRPTAPHFAERAPYVIAIIELDEGVRMTANLVECDPEQVTIGMRVEAVFVPAGPEAVLLQFRPAAAQA